jgi:hypothetical protein
MRTNIGMYRGGNRGAFQGCPGYRSNPVKPGALPAYSFGATASKSSRLGVYPMHDILIALVFVGMVSYPAVVAALPADDSDEESTVGLLPSLTTAAESCAVCDEAASLASR